jgi:hypothetical protein
MPRPQKPTLIFFGIILICLCYWLFLASYSRIILAGDSIGYINLASLFNTQGLVGYLKTGPNREPIYPFLLSLAIKLSVPLGRPFAFVAVYFQILFVLLTQILTYIALKRIRVHEYISLGIVFYIGISPAIMHSTFILYSEVITYPFILLVLLLAHQLWQSIKHSKLKLSFFLIFLISICLMLLTFMKASFEIISPLVILFLFILIRRSLPHQKRLQIYLTMFAIFLMTFYTPILTYKSLNKKYNGQFVLTDRGAWALYGQTARRMQPLTFQRTLSAIVFTSSWKNCTEIFSDQECQDWSFIASDDLGANKRSELSRQMSEKEVNHTLLKLSFDEILKNPLQYGFLMGIEAIKMFFWETTLVQYVYFPQIVFSIYNLMPVYFFFNFFLAVLTFVSFIYTFIFLWRTRDNNEKDDRREFIVLTAGFILIFVGIQCFFYILPRYILPIASLLLILIALFLERLFNLRQNS